MCSLCGVLGGDSHWTEAAVGPEASQAAADRPTRRRARQARIVLANRLLRHYRLQLGDFEGRSYVLRSATGRQAVVPDLIGMWTIAETLAGRACDPLDPELIAALERG